MLNKNAFCLGIACNKTDRKYKCVDCGIYVCGTCSVSRKGKEFCIDCYIERKFDEANKEIEEQLIKLNLTHKKTGSVINEA